MDHDVVVGGAGLAGLQCARLLDQHGLDVLLLEASDAAGVRGPLRDLVLEPFLADVILEDEGRTSAAFVRELVGWFLLGTPGLPAEGMGALPAWIHDGQRAPAVLGVRVESVQRNGEEGGRWGPTADPGGHPPSSWPRTPRLRPGWWSCRACR